MFCIRCGKAFSEGERFCPNCGVVAASNSPSPAVHVANHIVWAVLATIFFNTICGIVAIVYASQVNGFLYAGKIESARLTASSAATWIWISIAVSMICWFFVFFWVSLRFCR